MTRPLVGAYYYLWNPENLSGGTLRAHLDPPQQPPASLVDSSNPHAAGDITNGAGVPGSTSSPSTGGRTTLATPDATTSRPTRR